MVNGFEVDFWWPDIGLVVEADGLGYHRTPTQQAAALGRDQTHTSAGLTPLRFSHSEIRFSPGRVRETVSKVVDRLALRRSAPGPPERLG